MAATLAWLALMLVGVGLIAAYFLVQQRLGNNSLNVAVARATPLPSVTPTRSVEDFADAAYAAYFRGEYRKAIDLYDQALRRKPNDPVLSFRLARLLILTGQAARAEQRLQRVLQTYPNDVDLRAVNCMAIEWQGRISQALKECQAAVASDPSSPIANAYLAEAQADNGDFRNARASAQKAIDLSRPNSDARIDALRNMGYVRELEGQYNEALYYYGQALEIGPQLVHIIIAIGRTYVSSGNATRAIEYYERAIKLDKDSAEAHERIGTAYIAIGEFGKARVSLEQATKLDPNRHTAWNRLGVVNFQGRRYEDTIANITRAISITEQSNQKIGANDYIYLGFAYQLMNNCPRAVDAFNKAAEVAPNEASIQSLVSNGLRKCAK